VIEHYVHSSSPTSSSRAASLCRRGRRRRSGEHVPCLAHGTVLCGAVSVALVPRDGALLLFINVINRSWFIVQAGIAIVVAVASARPSVRPARVTAKNENLKRARRSLGLSLTRRKVGWMMEGCCLYPASTGRHRPGRAVMAGGVPLGTASIRYSLLTLASQCGPPWRPGSIALLKTINALRRLRQRAALRCAACMRQSLLAIHVIAYKSISRTNNKDCEWKQWNSVGRWSYMTVWHCETCILSQYLHVHERIKETTASQILHICKSLVKDGRHFRVSI